MKKIYPIYKKNVFYNMYSDSVVINTKKVVFHYLCNLYNFSHIYQSNKLYIIIPQKIALKKMMIDTSFDIIINPLGHSSIFIKYKNFNILIDPVFFSISFFFKRFTENICFDLFPPIDIVIYSHNHPDHYCKKTLEKIIEANPHVKIISSLKFDSFFYESFSSHLKVISLNWWEKYQLNEDIIITSLPAIHWSQSTLFDRNKTLWSSWMISIKKKNIYFAGDTAYGDHFKMIKEEFGTIDVACIPIAPCLPREIQIDSHIDVDESYQVFLDLGEPIFIPIHWGVFAYGEEKLKEPIEKIILLMKKSNNLIKLQSTIYNEYYGFNISNN